MPDGMIQKERKKRIIKQAAMKAILVIILVCIAMITFLLLFQVRKIEVSGNQYLSRQEIADWVQDDNWSSNSLYVMIRNHLMNHELLPGNGRGKCDDEESVDCEGDDQREACGRLYRVR